MDRHMTELENLIVTEYTNIAGIVVLKDSKKVYESYFDGFASEDAVHVMSVTKSVISALVGVAIDQGCIQNTEQKVLDFFPEYRLKRGEKTIQNISIKNMLTMTAPYKYKTEPYAKVYASGDWTAAALDLLGGRDGITGEFKYSTVGTQILSGILVRAAGKPVIEFAAEHLFEPLGIKMPGSTIINTKEEYFDFLKAKHKKGWAADPSGVNTAGWGLCLTPRDMAKIGQLYLDHGVCNGRQILSSEWTEASTTEKSRWKELPYGYLWWIIDCRGDRCYGAIGDGGNTIFVNPKKNMVIAITAQFVLRSKPILELITEHIVPLLG